MSIENGERVRYFRARIAMDVLFSMGDDDETVREFGNELLAETTNGVAQRHPGFNYAEEYIEVVELKPEGIILRESRVEDSP